MCNVSAPSLCARGAALVMSVKQGGHRLGHQIAVGAFGDCVHGAGAVVVGGQDRVQCVRGSMFGAPMQLVNRGLGGVLVVGFVGDGGVDSHVVFVAAAGHRDVGQGAAGPIGQHRPADSGSVGAADGHALGGVDGAGVAQGDVLAQVVAGEDGAGAVGEPLCGDTALLGVDADHAPPVAVAGPDRPAPPRR